MTSVVLTAVTTVGLALLKGAVSIIGFLLRVITAILRLILCALPVTGGCMLVIAGYLVVCSFAGGELLPEEFFYRPNPVYFMKSLDILRNLVSDYAVSLPGAVTVILWIAAAILAVPVLLALLLMHAGIALFRALIFLIPADLVLLILFSLLRGKTPFSLLQQRFLILFPQIALRRDEHAYHDWLRRHGDEFRQDSYGRRERVPQDPWEPDDHDRYRDHDIYGHPSRSPRRDRRALREEQRRQRLQAYYDEYDEPCEDDGEYDESYEEDGYSDVYEEEDGYGEAYEEDDSYEEEDGYRGYRDPGKASRGTAFDFFAGCRDLQSVEKKYRSLAKIYHPDNQDGDTAAIQEINRQYAEAKKRMRQ